MVVKDSDKYLARERANTAGWLSLLPRIGEKSTEVIRRCNWESKEWSRLHLKATWRHVEILHIMRVQY